MNFTSDNPVRDLEDFFLRIIRTEFPKEVYVLIGYKLDEEHDATPYDFVRIIFTGMTVRHFTGYNENNFNFQIVYSSHLPATMLPHRRTLAMLEKGRKILNGKLPPSLLNPLPLLLQSEKLGRVKKECECLPPYLQNWSVAQRVNADIIAPMDACHNEPNTLLLAPLDYITPIDQNYYSGTNSTYVIANPINNGNTQYIFDGTNFVLNPSYNPSLPTTNPILYYDTTTGMWVLYPYYDKNLPTSYGNLPFIPYAFLKQIGLTVSDLTTGTNLHSSITNVKIN